MSKHCNISSICFFSQIRLWNLPKKKCIRTITAHDGYVRGLCFHQNGGYFFSVRPAFVFLLCYVQPVVDQLFRYIVILLFFAVCDTCIKLLHTCQMLFIISCIVSFQNKKSIDICRTYFYSTGVCFLKLIYQDSFSRIMLCVRYLAFMVIIVLHCFHAVNCVSGRACSL